MGHTVQNQRPLLSRVRRIRGQLDGLEKALQDGGECGAVLQQIAAVRGAVNGLMNEVLEGHLRQHLVPADPDHPDDMDAVLRVLRSYLK